jgi:LPXTG-motif cell wall-anchored protein
MKKIFSILLVVTLIVIMSNGVFCHQGNLDSYGGHCVFKDGYIVAYHFHEGKLMGYELVLNTPVKSLQELKAYIKTLEITEISKIGTIRKMEETATTTITPSATASTATSMSTPSSEKINLATSKTLPKTGEKENILAIVAGFCLVLVGLFMFRLNYLGNKQ